MNEPAGQHLVAKFILRNFAGRDGFLHCFHKPSDRIFPTSPGKALRENHLYTTPAEDGTPSYAIEEDLGRLESALAPTLDKVITAARNDCFPALSAEEEEALRIFLWVQLRRSRTARDVLRTNLQLEESGTYEDDWRNSLGVPIDAESRAVLFNKGLVVGVIEDARAKALAIGDHPVILGGGYKYPITHPKAEISMPVASDVLVSLHGDRVYRELAAIDTIADQVNAGILVHSNTVATSSLERTQQLRCRWRTTPELRELALFAIGGSRYEPSPKVRAEQQARIQPIASGQVKTAGYANSPRKTSSRQRG